jgi:hypothetical protein
MRSDESRRANLYHVIHQTDGHIQTTALPVPRPSDGTSGKGPMPSHKLHC